MSGLIYVINIGLDTSEVGGEWVTFIPGYFCVWMNGACILKATRTSGSSADTKFDVKLHLQPRN